MLAQPGAATLPTIRRPGCPLMRPLLSLILSLVDPRGRCNRRGLLVIASLLLAVETMLVTLASLGIASPDGAGVMPVKVVVLWIAIAACAKRLHDIGRSAWAMALAVPVTLVWGFAATVAVTMQVGVEALVPSSPWYFACLGLTMVPVVAGTTWLHIAGGDSGPNRYGPAPEGLGIAGPHADRVQVVPADARPA